MCHRCAGSQSLALLSGAAPWSDTINPLLSPVVPCGRQCDQLVQLIEQCEVFALIWRQITNLYSVLEAVLEEPCILKHPQTFPWHRCSPCLIFLLILYGHRHTRVFLIQANSSGQEACLLWDSGSHWFCFYGLWLTQHFLLLILQEQPSLGRS